MFDPLHKWLGIPPSEQPPNDYRLLGLTNFEDDPEVIDAAADRDLTFLHNLTNGEHGELAEELSNRISAARIKLLTPSKKAAYDAELRAAAEEEVDIDDVLDHLGAADAQSPIAPSNASDRLAVPPGVKPPEHQPAIAPDLSQNDQSGRRPSDDVSVQAKTLPQLQEHLSRPRRRRGPLLIWLLGIAPGLCVLSYLLFSIWNGSLKLDQNKLEKIGVPSEQAARLAGSSKTEPTDESKPELRTNVIDDPTTLKQNAPSSSSDGSDSTYAPMRTGQPTGQAMVPTPPSMSSPPTPAAPSPNNPSTTGSPSSSKMNFSATAGTSNPSTAPPVSPPQSPSLAEYLTSSETSPIPAPKVLAAKTKTVGDLYRDDFQNARDRDARIAIADRIREAAEGTDNDPAGQFALYQVAGKIFLKENDVVSAVEIVDRLAEGFDGIDVMQKKRDILDGIETPAVAAEDYADIALSLMKTAMQAGQIHHAEAISKTLQSKLPRIPSSILPHYKVLSQQLKESAEMFQQYQTAAMVVESNPDDKNAQTKVGLYLCFVENDWDRGLQHLARGSNTVFREAAESELSLGNDGITELTVADKWFAAMESTKSQLQTAAVANHTKALYQTARLKTSGIETRKIDQRLIQLASHADPGPIAAPISRAEKRAAERLRLMQSQAKVIQTRTFDSSLSTDFAYIRGNTIQIGMGNRSSGTGEAAAGVELDNVGSITIVGTASHPTMTTSSSISKIGFFIDYHTDQGYSKRVFLNISTNTPSYFYPSPPWGTARAPDEREFLPNSPKYSINLEQWAPANWDGRCWFSLYMQNAGTGRMLTARLAWDPRKTDMLPE